MGGGGEVWGEIVRGDTAQGVVMGTVDAAEGPGPDGREDRTGIRECFDARCKGATAGDTRGTVIVKKKKR